jgi:hypothetical protein
MVEAPEKIWATFEPHESGKGHPCTYATAQKTKGQEYVRADLLERQIAELRAQSDRFCDKYLAALKRAEAAEAENARLKALPLKDEVERVLERSTNLLDAAGKAIEEDGWDMDFTHVDGISTDNIGFSTDCENSVSDARALLSRLRAGEQEGWRQCGWAYQDKQWDEDRWHVCGMDSKPREHDGRLVQPIYVAASPSVSEGGSRNG